ncbi:chemotaxis protein CheB [Chitinophaga ginsengisoli]|uniref:protein-glutamate methylesterase n=1 Tax=Chitinophaga ginsengisoli TaxID=363837 RepID=A0A2P8GD83_9BACT|nr:chemotaxis protein CheB [Chitinophaga ginsengisoli]PSL31927.1 two-component system chemotaxis response regulator CheB [Chitinophaga ginsengisoli]
MKNRFDVITIGGSAGSLLVLTDILDVVPYHLAAPVIIVLHRLRNVQSEMGRLLSSKRRIIEPEDKEPVKEHSIYLAPQNYHLLIEAEKTFMLDYSELVNYSRPSIDMTFSSIADVYGPRSLGILLSGANKDGAAGLCQIIAAGGRGIVQDPETAAFDAMPQSAIQMCDGVQILSIEDIKKIIIGET